MVLASNVELVLSARWRLFVN